MKWSLGKLLDNPRYAFVVSIAIAVVGWFVVAIVIDPQTTMEIKDIPININTQASAISRLELNAIDVAQSKVSVFVRGQRFVIGGITAQDFTVSASLAGVTGPGVYDLPLDVKSGRKGEDIEILQINPSSVRVKFDRLQSKTLPIEVQINGLAVPNEDYIVEKETISPATVSVTGPEIDVNKIDKAVAIVNLTGTVNKPIVVKQDIVFLDTEGNKVESSYISQDTSTAEVVVPVKKIVELPLTIGFNVPQGFPTEELSYTLSNNTIRVAGVPETLDNYSEIHLGYINLKDFNIFEPMTFPVPLPSGFTNLDNVESVIVEFNSEDFVTAKFNVTNFNLINQPAQFAVTVTTPRLTGVKVTGPKDLVSKITARDIVAEIDLSEREIAPGQYSLPVHVYIPNRGLVWATGDYTAVVSVKQK